VTFFWSAYLFGKTAPVYSALSNHLIQQGAAGQKVELLQQQAMRFGLYFKEKLFSIQQTKGTKLQCENYERTNDVSRHCWKSDHFK
jgi:hypothetical protein